MESIGAPDVMEDILDRMNGLLGSNYIELKPKQATTILQCQNNDVLCVLPTGYGKTVIIMALPFLSDMNGCVVVANALNCIMDEQRKTFGSSCVYVSEAVVRCLELDEINPSVSEETWLAVTRLKGGDPTIRYILGHPEQLVHPAVKKVLLSPELSIRITHLVVDEAHCVLQWGKSLFRPAYLKLGLLRAVVSKAKVLALTATATLDAQQTITKQLCMVNPSIVSESPNRPNVFLEVLKRPPTTGGNHPVEDSFNEVVDPILKKLKDEGKNFGRTIIYLPLKWCGLLHYRAEKEFLAGHPDHNSNIVDTGEREKLTCLVSQYHSPQSQHMKSLIVSSMQDPFGHLRLLFATEAYGMGTNVPNIRNIVHVGPPSNLETFVQEIGRCGRDGESARSSLYVNQSDVSSSAAHLTDDMRTYCQTTSCRRSFLMEYFGFEAPVVHDKHACCDNCVASCTCTSCENSSHMEATDCLTEKIPNKLKRGIANRSLVRYFQAENAIVNSKFPHLVTGLSDKLSNVLSAKLDYQNFSKLSKDFPKLKESYRKNISSILTSVYS